MIDALQNVVNAAQTSANRPNDEALRKAAMQFEAILLQQLTASLNSTNTDGDEDALFGSDSGTGLAKQLFSEQLATTMAQAGGIGLSDVLMQKFGAKTNAKPFRIKGLDEARSAVREIATPRAERSESKTPYINKRGKIDPIERNYGDGDAEIISTFVDEVKKEGLDDSLRGLMLDGRIVNSTRPRVVPNAPVTSVSADVPLNSDVWTRPTTPISSNGARVSYRFPVSGRVSSGFGNRFHPIDKRVKFHGGVDFAVPVGTKVAAAAEGVVKFAGWKGGYGNVVILTHADGSETLYGHNSKLLVTEGQTVRTGDPISLSGSTGKSTGPHLHFEVRRNGTLVNPKDFLSNVLTEAAER